MTKENIIYYTEGRVPMSLRELELTPTCQGRVEYLFYAVNLSRNFDELTEELRKIINVPIHEVARGSRYITYKVETSWGDENYLKFVVDEVFPPYDAYEEVNDER